MRGLLEWLIPDLTDAEIAQLEEPPAQGERRLERDTIMPTPHSILRYGQLAKRHNWTKSQVLTEERRHPGYVADLLAFHIADGQATKILMDRMGTETGPEPGSLEALVVEMKGHGIIPEDMPMAEAIETYGLTEPN